MLYLGTIISFENLELAQIYGLTNQKISNLDFDQILLLFLK